MSEVRIRSIEDPFDSPDLMRSALETITLTDAMGLLPEEAVIEALDLLTVREVAGMASKAGIAPSATAALLATKFDRPPGKGGRRRRIGKAELDELAAAIEALRDGLEESPVPEFELRSLLKLFDAEELSSLVGTSVSSLRRYASGTRRTPDDVAARLHFLAMAVGELKGSYNEIGVRRWFRRRRSALGERPPSELLQGSWNPEDPGPAEVLALARSLVSSPAT
jgi:hypothetical protein